MKHTNTNSALTKRKEKWNKKIDNSIDIREQERMSGLKNRTISLCHYLRNSIARSCCFLWLVFFHIFSHAILEDLHTLYCRCVHCTQSKQSLMMWYAKIQAMWSPSIMPSHFSISSCISWLLLFSHDSAFVSASSIYSTALRILEQIALPRTSSLYAIFLPVILLNP